MNLLQDEFHKESHLCHVPKAKSVHALDEFAVESMLAQQCHKDDGFLVGAGQYAHRSIVALC